MFIRHEFAYNGYNLEGLMCPSEKENEEKENRKNGEGQGVSVGWSIVYYFYNTLNDETIVLLQQVLIFQPINNNSHNDYQSIFSITTSYLLRERQSSLKNVKSLIP